MQTLSTQTLFSQILFAVIFTQPVFTVKFTQTLFTQKLLHVLIEFECEILTQFLTIAELLEGPLQLFVGEITLDYEYFNKILL